MPDVPGESNRPLLPVLRLQADVLLCPGMTTEWIEGGLMVLPVTTGDKESPGGVCRSVSGSAKRSLDGT